jgi:undecaprenyl-phosphate 4-deoxy-4-formamido-L-arabinose transferase
MRNFGQHNALLAGIRAARYQVIVTMDDDLQNPPEEIPRLLGKLDEGNDVVYGIPQIKQHGYWRIIGSHMTRLILSSAMGINVATNASGFRAFRTRLRDAFAAYNDPFVVIDVLLSWGTTRFAAIPVRQDKRKVAKSNYTIFALVVLAWRVITGYSSWPLRLASLVGFGFTFIGLGVFFHTLIRYLIEGGTVPGVRFLGSLFAIFAEHNSLRWALSENISENAFSHDGTACLSRTQRTQHQ